MKLIIQIPCYNEETTLPSVLWEIPKKIDGIDEILTMIIDDGSSDNTLQVAQKHGVDIIIAHRGNKWLGNAFSTGLHEALAQGADILVNTDGDNQYPGKYIPDLVAPIIAWEADIVIWDRQTDSVEHFSASKKFFQKFGSSMVRQLSGVDIIDSVSGFRAYSREALLALNITSDFSYAVDTLVQAGSKKLKITNTPITINAPTRESRLFKNMWEHMFQTGTILTRVYSMYHPMRVFFALALSFGLLGFFGVMRFLYFYIQNPENTGHIQSLILSGTLLIMASVFFSLGIIADLIAKNRKLIEDDLYLTKKNYYSRK